MCSDDIDCRSASAPPMLLLLAVNAFAIHSPVSVFLKDKGLIAMMRIDVNSRLQQVGKAMTAMK